MENPYKTLGIPLTASHDEIRIAYRILARRYHPDLNPEKDSTDIFKNIASAYEILSDPEKKRAVDDKLSKSDKSEFFRRYEEHQAKFAAERRYKKDRRLKDQEEINKVIKTTTTKNSDKKISLLKKILQTPSKIFKSGTSLSVIEVSVSIEEAIYGTNKVIDITGDKKPRRVAINVPIGVRTGSVITMRPKEGKNESLLAIIRVQPHSILKIEQRGIIAEIPITVREAIQGASIRIPTLEDPVLLKIPQGTQSGDELRIKGKGIQNKNGIKGDLFVRFLIQVPLVNSLKEDSQDEIKELSNKLERSYEKNVRSHLGESLLNKA